MSGFWIKPKRSWSASFKAGYSAGIRKAMNTLRIQKGLPRLIDLSRCADIDRAARQAIEGRPQ